MIGVLTVLAGLCAGVAITAPPPYSAAWIPCVLLTVAAMVRLLDREET